VVQGILPIDWETVFGAKAAECNARKGQLHYRQTSKIWCSVVHFVTPFRSKLALFALSVFRLSALSALAMLTYEGVKGNGLLVSEEQTAIFPFRVQRSDKEQILDAILLDVLNNPVLKDTRDFYGTQRDKHVVLVTSMDYGVPWPVGYQPALRGWSVSRAQEGNFKPDMSKRLGVRIDKYFNENEKTARIIRHPVAVTILNAGGYRGGIIVVGGCSVYYRPKKVGGKWVVEFEGAMDP